MPATASAPPFPPVVVGAVRAAAEDFFTTSCKLGLTPSPDPQAAGGAAIMGVMSFFGDPVWSFALILPEPVAVAAALGFAGFDIPFDSPDMGDMVGEMANVMAGDIVARLERARVKAQMSLPTVTRGHDVELLPPSHAQEVRAYFSSPAGGVQIRLFQALVSAPAGFHPHG